MSNGIRETKTFFLDDIEELHTKLVDALILAARRLELLREAKQWIDVYQAYLPLVTNNTKMNIFMDKLAEELGDDAEHKTGYGPNDWS